MAAKRPREEDPSAPAPAQSLDLRANDEKVVKNSPYGTTGRAALGWGNPFKPPVKVAVPLWPGVRVGMSSLNGTPGKVRDMPKLLQQYTKKFTCLEHCNPYHRMGEPNVWDGWKAMAPPGFLFTVKANQYLTHTRNLELDADTADHIKTFYGDRCQRLGDKLGAVLLQLPPTFRFTDAHIARVRAVASAMPQGMRVAVEFRHGSWHRPETYAVLREVKWAMVATHTPGIGEGPVVDTGAGFMYVRLHGAVEQYAGDYGHVVMGLWAERVQRFLAANGASAPVFFFLNNNESHVAALTSSVVDATALGEELVKLSQQPLPDTGAPSCGKAEAVAEAVAPAADVAAAPVPPPTATPAAAAATPTEDEVEIIE